MKKYENEGPKIPGNGKLKMGFKGLRSFKIEVDQH